MEVYCECYRIPSKNFYDYLDSDVSHLHEVIRFSAMEYDRLMQELTAHSENAIGNYLCQLIYELSGPTPDGKRVLSGKYTNEFLSKMSGVTTVTMPVHIFIFCKKA